MKKSNPVWRFFASVKLALFCLFMLATTSVLGTLVPQKNPAAFYVQQYGPNLARLFQVLDIPDMYNSWWFLGLLGLFSLNLIICSLDRLPNVWRLVTMDNLATSLERLEKMRQRTWFASDLSQPDTLARLEKLLAASGWRPRKSRRDDGVVLFSQKGAWTRLGVYAVHMSILIIFAGAIIGSQFGFKASVMIPEGRSTGEVYAFGSHRPIPLGFKVRCDKFEVEYYPSGMPKEYRSELTVLDPDRSEPYHKAIEVNDPLTYKGITFYQSSYEPINEFMVEIENRATKAKQAFRVPPARQVQWPGTDISFGIINMSNPNQPGGARFKIWFSDTKTRPSIFWMPDGVTATIKRPDAEYAFSLKQLYATGLQVTRDPGVWVVYLGCILMLVGLYVAFFLSHQRLWVYTTEKQGRTRLLVSGTSNKNPAGFKRRFQVLCDQLAADGHLERLPPAGGK